MTTDDRPTPDPTRLTVDQLERAEERMLREVESATKLLRAEADAMDRDCAEKFSSVRTQFALIERQRVEQKEDTEKAVQAALSAAKEAVKEQTASSEKSITKSETATAEQLKQLTATFDTAIKGLTDVFADLKERVGNIEAGKAGAQEVKTVTSANTSNLVAGAALLVAAVAVVVPQL